MKWINFLHLYQPANIDAYHIKEATDLSYERLARILEEHPGVKFTLNISGCLFLRWEELGYTDLIERWKKLLQAGQIELTGSAAYHALLPLMTPTEMRRQIKEQDDILQKYLGADFKPRGFFLPEMAYSEAAAKIIKEFGYEWIILDEISYNGEVGAVNFQQVYIDKNSGLKVVFRSREFSNCYVPDRLLEFFQKQDLVITATDAELYGLRHQDPTQELEKVLQLENLTTELVSEFVATAPAGPEVKVLASNWEATSKELHQGRPYALWYDQNNKIQMQIWELANLADRLTEKYSRDNIWARWHLVRGLASCTFWWASGRDFSHNFGPQAWSPDEIERGVNELIRAVRSLHEMTTRKEKLTAEKLYLKVKKLIWQKHWRYYSEK